MELTEETDVRLTTTRRFKHVGMCTFGKFYPCAETSPIFVHFGLVADIIVVDYTWNTMDFKMNLFKFIKFSAIDFTGNAVVCVVTS